jgi:hypothetical protein
MLASSYFLEGLTLALRGPGRGDSTRILFRFMSMSLDFVFALVLVVVGIGLLFAQRWARKMWLITMSILTTLHLLLTVLSQLGLGVSTVHLLWTWLMVLLTMLSWWYFTKADTKAVQPVPSTVDQMP